MGKSTLCVAQSEPVVSAGDQTGLHNPVIDGLPGQVEARYGRFDRLRASVDPFDGSWLTESEYSEVRRFRNESRREAWLFGRWLGKRLLRAQFGINPPDPAEIEILSRDGEGRAVRPVLRIGGDQIDGCLSIAHSDRGVLVALSTQLELSVGVDLAVVGKAGPGFIQTWFTPGEQSHLAGDDGREAAVFWAAKEAVYKACNQGESFVPRNVEVFRDRGGVYCGRYRDSELSADIHVGSIDGHLAVIATHRPWRASPPVPHFAAHTESRVPIGQPEST